MCYSDSEFMNFGLLISVATSITFDSGQFLESSPVDQARSSTFSNGDQALVAATNGLTNDLASIAASATQLQASPMELDPSTTQETTDDHGPFDVYSELQALKSPSTWPSKRTTIQTSSSHEVVAGLDRTSALSYGVVVETNSHPRNDTTGEQQPKVQKIRGKFSDARRKEVQEVRKRGACIRCRMLRKTVRIVNLSQVTFILTALIVFWR